MEEQEWFSEAVGRGSEVYRSEWIKMTRLAEESSVS